MGEEVGLREVYSIVHRCGIWLSYNPSPSGWRALLHTPCPWWCCDVEVLDGVGMNGAVGGQGPLAVGRGIGCEGREREGRLWDVCVCVCDVCCVYVMCVVCVFPHACSSTEMERRSGGRRYRKAWWEISPNSPPKSPTWSIALLIPL